MTCLPFENMLAVVSNKRWRSFRKRWSTCRLFCLRCRMLIVYFSLFIACWCTISSDEDLRLLYWFMIGRCERTKIRVEHVTNPESHKDDDFQSFGKRNIQSTMNTEFIAYCVFLVIAKNGTPDPPKPQTIFVQVRLED